MESGYVPDAAARTLLPDRGRQVSAEVLRVVLPDTCRAPSVARAEVALALGPGGSLGPLGVPEQRVVHDLQLIVSELVTNALRHGRCPYILSVSLTAGEIRVAVEDLGQGPPSTERAHEVDDATGRGLLIVSRLAGSWGVEHQEPGTTVWATIPLGVG